MPNKNTIDQELARQMIHLLNQAMLKIDHCLNQLNDEQIWWRPNDSMNSIGNLLLHMGGNLRQWAIASIGNQPAARDRQSEFEQREIIPATELIQQTSQTVLQTGALLKQLSPSAWLEPRTIQGFDVTVAEAIIHTTTHFVGHTHQIILLTRMQLGTEYEFQWTPASESAR